MRDGESLATTRPKRDPVRLVAGVLLAYSLVLGVLGTLVGLFAGPHILIPGLALLAFAATFGRLMKRGTDVRGWHCLFHVTAATLFGILHMAQLVMLITAGGWEERFVAILPACIAGLSLWLGWAVGSRRGGGEGRGDRENGPFQEITHLT